MLRPRNISMTDLLHYHFPLSAIVSILHRISGLLMVFCIPGLLLVLQYSLSSPSHFEVLRQAFWMRGIAWLFLSIFSYHLVAGIRHLCMDFGFFETKTSGFWASMVVLFLSAIFVAGWGVWLW